MANIVTPLHQEAAPPDVRLGEHLVLSHPPQFVSGELWIEIPGHEVPAPNPTELRQI
jgi:hypothetical protein